MRGGYYGLPGFLRQEIASLNDAENVRGLNFGPKALSGAGLELTGACWIGAIKVSSSLIGGYRELIMRAHTKPFCMRRVQWQVTTKRLERV